MSEAALHQAPLAPPARVNGQRRKQQKKVPWQSFQQAAQPLKLGDRELSIELGLAADTVGHWRRQDKAPAWAVAAAEGLVARAGLRAEQVSVMLLSVPADKRVAVESFVDALGLSRTWV
jgi:ketosteroid isomerase-like protein